MFTDSVLCYIKNCIDTVTVDKHIQVYPNQKPWMSKEVQQLLKARNNAFRSRDGALYSAARTNLKRGIRKAKSDYNNTFVKFTDDTTVVGLISKGDESNYRDEVEQLAGWCRANNLLLNTSKTKELIVDFRRKKTDIQPLLIGGTCVERVSDFRFLGVNIMEDLIWDAHTTELVKKAQQRLYFLRVLRRNNIPQKQLVSFYRCSIESIMSYCLCVCGFQAALWHREKSSRGS
ncbi:uncharacterized protein LOC120553194 [Perca fluviatilis]|uniref:uncharacterized protein LOC120553194 n=1 Tax=Perca fluviatilis TaxID=8168 RepID=UPI001964E339|nr:uncharacterized protein LOC120553194 [Perca fluviatilis]XP_039647288.1 uncharacterized protein LOC120553194 [Perca fluviatilis]